MSARVLVLVESNTTGTGRLFCARARELGLRPVLLARDPGRYPYVALDAIDTVVVDTTSFDAVLGACRALAAGPDRVDVTSARLDRADVTSAGHGPRPHGGAAGRVVGVTSSSEYFIGTASAAARALGLPHADPDAIRTARDKSAARLRLRDSGVPSPAFAAATTPADAVAAARRIGLPVVVKPVAGSGSIGVRRCASAAEVADVTAWILGEEAAAAALPPQSAVLVEEYLDGPEFSVETIDDHVVGVTRKHLGPEPHFLEIGHDFPATGPDATAIGDAAVAALRALGLGWGAAHVELRLTAGGPRVVEVNPRLAGGMIPRMVQEATGVDLVDLVVRRAAGLDAAPRPTRAAHAAIRFVVAAADGTLVALDGVDAARAVPGVVEVGTTRAPGAEIVIRHAFTDRLAYVVAAGPSGSVAARSAERGASVIEARVAPAALVTEGSDIS